MPEIALYFRRGIIAKGGGLKSDGGRIRGVKIGYMTMTGGGFYMRAVRGSASTPLPLFVVRCRIIVIMETLLCNDINAMQQARVILAYSW